ncbi:MAG TPA: magnesium transporter [Actinomycetota bacterium]|nr:magnesium transporter [Actinomycetota bacterium]
MAREEITELKEVVFETAGEHVATRVPVTTPGERVGDVRSALQGRRFDTTAAVAVSDRGLLVGLIRMEDLLAAPADAPIREVMDVAPPLVGPGVDQEVAAWQAVQHGESVVAVADEQGRFLGLVPPQRLLAVLLWEHEDDMARLGGFLHDAATARRASREPVLRRLWHRLPWLVVGLLGAFLAAVIVGSFEEGLRRNVVLAFFIPGIVYMADAVGTQTETLIIRGLSVGVPEREGGEAGAPDRGVGGARRIGGVSSGGHVAWDSDVALAAALALLVACSTATLVAMVLPWP